jgi:hypothetical protein
MLLLSAVKVWGINELNTAKARRRGTLAFDIAVTKSGAHRA